MREISTAYDESRTSLAKILGAAFVICALLAIAFLFTPHQIGPVKKPRGKVLLEYFGLIKDKRSNVELVKALKSSDEEKQLNAILAMAYRSYSPDNSVALVNYLRSDSVTKSMKHFAIWALGELRAKDAREFLYSLKGDDDFDQYEVDKAIKKIEGKISRPPWRK